LEQVAAHSAREVGELVRSLDIEEYKAPRVAGERNIDDVDERVLARPIAALDPEDLRVDTFPCSLSSAGAHFVGEQPG
jgi:hypothetical protein